MSWGTHRDIVRNDILVPEGQSQTGLVASTIGRNTTRPWSKLETLDVCRRGGFRRAAVAEGAVSYMAPLPQPQHRVAAKTLTVSLCQERRTGWPGVGGWAFVKGSI